MEVADRIHQLAEQFQIADKELLDQRALLRRIDQKYILNKNQLGPLLERLQNNYAIVVSGQKRLAEYHNTYFDTKDFLFLKEHLRGRKPRYKVRIRDYIDRKISVLECKKKDASGITSKARIEVPFTSKSLAQQKAFIQRNSPYTSNELHIGICNQFYRITLLSLDYNERLTIDNSLRFSLQQHQKILPECIIVETKRERNSRVSKLHRLLLKVNAQQLSFSKYCMAGYFFVPTVKNNLYRPKIKILRKIVNDCNI